MRVHIIAIIIICVVIVGLAWCYVQPVSFSFQVNTRPTIHSGIEKNFISISGQECIFLLTVEDEPSWLQGTTGIEGYVKITSQAPTDIASVTIQPNEITPGQIAEIIVRPTLASLNQTFTVTVKGERLGVVQEVTLSIEVISGEDSVSSYATEMRDMFVPWFEVNYPELGISAQTEWTSTIVNPRILVVMHYIFYSEEWEMYVTWHVMIPPHDWTRVYLRQRFTELRPSYAFEISSVEGQKEPHSIEVPDWV